MSARLGARRCPDGGWRPVALHVGGEQRRGLGVDVSGASLRTTTNPVRAAGLGAFPVGIVATDVNGHTFPYTITVTLT
jgi:hypothetical protein